MEILEVKELQMQVVQYYTYCTVYHATHVKVDAPFFIFDSLFLGGMEIQPILYLHFLKYSICKVNYFFEFSI